MSQLTQDKERLEIAKTMEVRELDPYPTLHLFSCNCTTLQHPETENSERNMFHPRDVKSKWTWYAWCWGQAHAQFCYPGDHTLEARRVLEGCNRKIRYNPNIEATLRAIMEIGSQEADERLVLVVSDADLQRRGFRGIEWIGIGSFEDLRVKRSRFLLVQVQHWCTVTWHS